MTTEDGGLGICLFFKSGRGVASARTEITALDGRITQEADCELAGRWVVTNYAYGQVDMDGEWARFRAYWAKPVHYITALVVIACFVILVVRFRKQGGGGFFGGCGGGRGGCGG